MYFCAMAGMLRVAITANKVIFFIILFLGV
jgi:hypothetical protein